ncbi:nucleotide sugar dehydrogenase [Candidatus Bathyarchaeota archaeon]|nr:nucleotide sugar dehydrogenase [Candidatus Bathyarchaeota archaeon]
MLLTRSTETKALERGEWAVSIVGCGRLGLLHACLFAEAGFKVICIDSDQAIIERILKGKVPFLKHEAEPILRKCLASGRLKATSDLKAAMAHSNVILVATSAIVDDKGGVDYSPLEKALKSIGSILRREALIILTSVVGIGVIEGFLKEILENSSGFRAGSDFYLAYSPILFPEIQTLNGLSNCRRIVAASDRASLEIALNVIKSVTNAEVIPVQSLKMAEAIALFEAAFQNVNSALANEFAFLCEKLGIDYFVARNFLGSNTNMHMQSTSTSEALKILLEEAENLNVKLRISEAALGLDEEVLRHKVELVRDALKSCGKPLRRAKIALLGFSQTPNTADIPKYSAKKIVSMLEKKGVKLTLYDPYTSWKAITDLEHAQPKKSLVEAIEGADCIVILAAHEQLKRLNLRKLKLLAKMPAAIVDLEGILDPVKVEAEGFIYRGFGRGVWKK